MHVGSPGGQSLQVSPQAFCAQGSQGSGVQPAIIAGTHADAPSQRVSTGGGGQLGSAGSQGSHGAPQGRFTHGCQGGGQSSPAVHGHVTGAGTHEPTPSQAKPAGEPVTAQLGSAGSHRSQAAPQGALRHGGGGTGHAGGSSAQVPAPVQ